MRKITRFAFALLLPLAGLLTMPTFGMVENAFGADDVVSTQKLLPNSVLAYFSIPNTQQLKGSILEGSSGKLFQDPQFEEFAKQFQEPIEKISNEFEEKTGLTIEQVLNIPSGEVAFAVVAGNRTTPIGIVAFLDFGDKREEIDKLLALAKKAAEDDANVNVSTEEIEGTEIVKFLDADNGASNTNPDGNEPEMYPCYFIKDSMIVVGNHVSFLENVLTRWDGKHARTFNDNIEYQYIIKRCTSEGGTPLFKWYFNPMSLVQSLVSIGAQEEPGIQMAMGFLPILGVDRFKGMGGVVEGPTDEFESVSRSFMFVDLPAKGVLAMFQFVKAEHTPPQWVPENTSSYASFQWDIESAFTAVGTMVDSFQGAGAFERMIDQAATEGPQIHLKKDILDQLNGQVHLINETSFDPTNNDIEAMGNIGKILFALGLNDPAGFENLIKKLIDQSGGFPGETRDFSGTTIYEIETVPGQSMAFAVASRHLFFTNDVARLEAVIRDDPDQKSLADNPEYKKIAAKMPRETSMISFQRQDAQLEAVYEMLRSGTFNQLIAASGEENPIDEINFSLLPPFEAVKKYLSAAGGYAEPDDQGVLFVGYQLRANVE